MGDNKDMMKRGNTQMQIAEFIQSVGRNWYSHNCTRDLHINQNDHGNYVVFVNHPAHGAQEVGEWVDWDTMIRWLEANFTWTIEIGEIVA